LLISDWLEDSLKYEISLEGKCLIEIYNGYKQQIKKIVERTEFLSSSKKEELAIYDKML
jgi:hypothetical protein